MEEGISATEAYNRNLKPKKSGKFKLPAKKKISQAEVQRYSNGREGTPLRPALNKFPQGQ